MADSQSEDCPLLETSDGRWTSPKTPPARIVSSRATQTGGGDLVEQDFTANSDGVKPGSVRPLKSPALPSDGATPGPVSSINATHFPCDGANPDSVHFIKNNLLTSDGVTAGSVNPIKLSSLPLDPVTPDSADSLTSTPFPSDTDKPSPSPSPSLTKGLRPRPAYSAEIFDPGCDCDALDAADSENGQSATHRQGVLYPKIATYDSLASSSCGPGTAPLAQKESLECHCEELAGLKCHCSSPSAPSNPYPEIPKVSFRIEGYEEDDDPQVNRSLLSFPDVCGTRSDYYFPDAKSPAKAIQGLSNSLSNSKSGMLSASSSTASMPMCRICHFPQGETTDALISPCRCAGTMQFIHESCLMKWIDVSKTKKAASCELCNYEYNRHKKFRLRHWELPRCSRIDKLLHTVFVLCLLIMATCAVITVYCFKQDRYIKRRQDIELTKSEIVTLTCGVLFFVAFFTAMYVEVKAKETLYRLFNRFVRMNQTWHIHDYDKRNDNQDVTV